MAAHRYWKIHVSQNFNPGWAAVILSELQFRATVGGPALTGTWTGSPTADGAGGNVVDNLHDGSFATFYQSGQGAHPSDCFIQIDLGAGVTSDVAELALAQYVGDEQYCPQAFTLQSSDDGANWALVAVFGGILESAYAVNTFTTFAVTPLPAGGHAYWRMFIAQASRGNADFIGLQYLDFQDGNGNTLCAGGTALESSDDGHPASGAFPGGGGLWYSRNQRPCWIGYQFPYSVTPGQVNITPANASNNVGDPTLMDIQYSDDGVTWTHAWYMTQPDAWVRDGATLYAYPRPPAVPPSPAQYWMVLSTLNGNGSIGRAVVAEMALFGVDVDPIPGVTDPGGAGNAGIGFQSWAAAFDGSPASGIDAGANGSTFPMAYVTVAYPAPVDVYGLSIQCTNDGVNAPNVPVEGVVLCSTDRKSWTPAWAFNAGNRDAGPPINPGVVSRWNTPPPVTNYAQFVSKLAAYVVEGPPDPIPPVNDHYGQMMVG